MAEESIVTRRNTNDNPTKDKLFNLTTPQKNIWSVDKYYSNTSINNISGTVFFHEEIDVYKMQTAVNVLIRLYDAFSLQFVQKDNEIQQYFDKDIANNFYAKIYKLADKNELAEFEREASHTVFDGKKLFDVKVFQLDNKHGGFVFSTHHILGDSWSLGIVYNTVVNVYYDILNNPHLLPKYNKDNFAQLEDFIELEKEVLRVGSYTDFIEKENEYIKSPTFEKDKAFWNGIFDNVPDLPKIAWLDNKIQEEASCEGVRKEFKIPIDIMEKIQGFCKENKTSVFNFLMSIYSIYISNISGLNDFVIGTPVLNRSTFAEKHTVGMYVSTMPLRINVDPKTSFIDFSKKISNDTFSCFRHQHYPYEALLNDLREKNGSVPNLYNTLFSYQIIRNITDKFDCESYWNFNGNAGDDLQIHIVDYNNTGALSVLYDYKKSAYTFEDIKNIHARIEHMINQVLLHTNTDVGSIEVVTPEEKSQILDDFNNTDVDYPRDKTVVELFEDQVKKTPDNIAVVFEDQKLTYKELNEKANSLAKYLRDKEIKNNDLVGIMCNRSLEMIVSIIAVLKSGAAYIPIDPSFPKDRIDYMLSISESKLLLTQKCLEDSVDYKNKVFVDLSNSELYSLDNTNLKNTNISEDLAFIIFTSGSTGKPKGVMLPHRVISNFTHYCNNYIDYLKNEKYQTILSITTVSFDIFFFETIVSLQKGLKVVIANEDEKMSPSLLNGLIKKHNITIMQSTPSIMQIFMNSINDIPLLKNIKYVTLAGEQLPLSLMKALDNLNNMTVYNGYGPSETNYATLYKMDTSKITIGKPLYNDKILILNNYLNILPVGVPGELYISGESLSKGYINNKELTDKSFISNPYIKDCIMYKTGDLGIYKNDGNIICLGRSDHQVKIRGQRIEPEEIENQLSKLSFIKSCVVVKKVDTQKHEFLVSYFTSDEKADADLMREHLSKHLPKYMIPQYYVQLAELPYTPNGKIDRKALPDPIIQDENRTIILPRNDFDSRLLDIFKELLKIESVSIKDSFFELGGDSLSAINLCAKIQNEFNVQLFVRDVMEHPILSDLSDIIAENKNSHQAETIKPIKQKDFYKVSSAQKRIYFASQTAGNSIVYNVPGGVIFDGKVDEKRLEYCLNKLIKRHETLRTYFELNDDTVVQKILDKLDFKLEIINHVSFEKLNDLFDDFVQPFDLSKAPLFRAKLIRFNNNKSAFLMDFHHIICDGSSLTIFIDELCKLYNGDNLSKLEISYKDFASYENEKLQNGKFKEAKKYWMDQFDGELPVLNMPVQFPRPAVQSFEGAKIHATINHGMKDQIEKLANELSVTPYMILLACYYILLSKYTLQNDIVVGSPVVGRDIESTSNLVGMFINTLALREKLNNNLTIKKFILQLKENLLNSYKFQTYPFDELVNDLEIKRDTSHSPLFDTLFTYQNSWLNDFNFDGTKSEYYIPDSSISKYDLSLEIRNNDTQMDMSFEYATKLFTKDFINNLSNHYLNILYDILSNTNMKISEIDMLSENERNKILNEFNNITVDYNRDISITKMFENQVDKSSDVTAIVFEDQSLTYKELNEKSNQLAHYLQKEGVEKGNVIPVIVNRSPNLIISMLAIIKLGAVYLPISPDTPVERINYIIENSKAKCAIGTSSENLTFEKNIQIINIDNLHYANLSSKNLDIEIKPDDVLYIIYTSGSTGNPKGVKVCHRNLANFVASFNSLYGDISSRDRLLSSTNISFDVCIFEFFMSLLNGCSLYLYNEPNIRDVVNYAKTLHKYKITFAYIPPNILEEVFNLLSSYSSNFLNKMLIGVEPIKTSVINKYFLLNPNLKILNAYGPTETTICATGIIVDNNIIRNYKTIPIGKPLHNLKVFILDNHFNPVPVGVPGEIYIAGDNVSKGYFNNKELTDKSFVALPNLNCKLAYKTGDLAKWNEHGIIDFIGRNDFQVKINGHRIELGEIEKQIMGYKGITKSVVVVKNIKGRNMICGYFISPNRVTISLLRNHLSKSLPNYMVPAHLIQLEDFEYTSNGKINRKTLPTPKMEDKEIIYPKTVLEKKLLVAWKNILSLDEISINDNFFEIGGDSLCALKLQIELMKQNISVSYGDIFNNNTIQSLANFIENDSEKIDYPKYHRRDFRKINKILRKNNAKYGLQLKERELRDILLTGATGYLGIHILAELLKIDNIKIYCIVRNDPGTSAEEKLKNKFKYYFNSDLSSLLGKRIIVVPGEITESEFGLSEEEYKKLAHSVYHVINCAANVRHYGNYEDFEKVNVTGVKNLVEFCEGYGKDFIQVSTLSVSGNTLMGSASSFNPKKQIYFGEENLFVKQILDNVYVRSKFEAEKFVLEELANKKLNGIILRVGNITHRYFDGKFQENARENAFVGRLKAFLYLKMIPESMLNAYVEFSPVDFVAKSVVESCKFYNDDMSVLHLYNSKHLYINNFIDILSQLGISIKVVDDKTFNEKLRNILYNSVDVDRVSILLNDMDKNGDLFYKTNLSITNNFTLKFLNEIGFDWPEIVKAYIKKVLDNL